MVTLFEQNIRTADRQSSKGNQLKWENAGIWYKADFMGYEGLAEYIVSHLLRFSNLQEQEYVLYDLEQIQYRHQIYQGAKSRDFLYDDWQIITLERLFQNFFGESLYLSMWRIPEPEERLKFLVSQVQRITGLQDFGIYLNKLFTLDAIFLNEDRHTHNIAVLMNGKGEYQLCPIFDNGAALLADTTQDYPLGEDPVMLINEVHAKTCSESFEEQLIVSDELYGCNLKFWFTHKDVQKLLEEADIYPQNIRERVLTVIRQQMRKYCYLFR